MEMDSSVPMVVGTEINTVSKLEPDDFAGKVLSLMPSDVKSADLGCGRILTDWSGMFQTRYVLCDIYEDGIEDTPERRRKYRIEIKYGQKSSRVADVVYGAMFLLAFWLASKFNVIALVLACLLVVVALLMILLLSKSKFGPEQCEKIKKMLQSEEK